MTREKMMASMPASEFLEWRVLEKLEPYGEYGEYRRHGQIMALLMNMFKDKDTPSYTPDDFMPQFEDPVRKSDQEIDTVMMAIQRMQEIQLANNG